MTIADKLNYLNTTKGLIKTAIEGKGVTVSTGSTFRSYAGYIDDISVSGTVTLSSVNTCTIGPYSTYTNITATALPTSEPSTPQVLYTIADGQFPTFSGTAIVAASYVAGVYANILNSSTAAYTLYYKVTYNDVTIATGSSSVSGRNKACLNAHGLSSSVKIGDTVKVYLWASNVSLQLAGYSLRVDAAHIKPVNDSDIVLFNSGWTIGYSCPSNVSTNWSGKYPNFTKYISASVAFNYIYFDGVSYVDREHPTYGIITTEIATAAQVSVETSSAYYYSIPYRVFATIYWQTGGVSL